MDFELEPGKKLVRIQDDGQTSVRQLFDNFREMIEKADETRDFWNPRARPTLEKAITVLRQYAAGLAGTPDVKAQFAALGMLGGTEVLMTESETIAVYCVTEVAHAAAHLGHYVMAKSRKGNANQAYANIHKSYVKMGLQLAMRLYRQLPILEHTKGQYFRKAA
jgi:hypothetical protein